MKNEDFTLEVLRRKSPEELKSIVQDLPLERLDGLTEQWLTLPDEILKICFEEYSRRGIPPPA